MSMIFSLFGGPNFESFLDIVFGRILVRSWEGFEGILDAVDTKSRSRSGSGSGGEGGGRDGGGGVGFWW